jgi:hypothetical protein
VAEIKHVRFDVPDVGKNSVRLFQYHAGPPIHSIPRSNSATFSAMFHTVKPEEEEEEEEEKAKYSSILFCF